MAEIQLRSRIKGRDVSNFWRLGRKRRVHPSTIFRAVRRKLKEEETQNQSGLGWKGP